ncbi:MAG: HlyD family type I secretion periplasmic adaptor subunit [Methylicorpusculum sp.]|uniref:HlyD family type I secretion periplasmic adaptor subunit n=1 Tax=Methylicorpusculum sp. TaxID=2713644 RepID=UPI0027282763|nr:HlyD family type I secretion periplasmic adaptor subunit [Methylicorpusculum sp.]MDO8940150.1 HlyD family type I secretion periplasmic adaptor subunit [Methylicorpusculum sp.]MDP2202187.1 HlyD family type I secretion periplasmic adaptor subunit [Methylicorpusculum sp.]
MSMSLQFDACCDLFKRYGAIFVYAWEHRAEHDLQKRLQDEAQFLPAALALQETPVSPTPRLAAGMLVAFAGLAFLWAVFGRIDVVASAQGKIVPNDRIKTIQSLEAATVKAIYVTDGQFVMTGEVLIELDPTTALADQHRLQSDLISARLQVARGLAMLAALDKGTSPSLKRHPDSDVNDEDKFQEAKRLLSAQFGEYLAKNAVINSEISRYAAELHSTQILVRKLELIVPIARQRAEDYKNLVELHFVSRHDFLEQEQNRIEQEGNLANLKSRLKEIDAMKSRMLAQRTELAAETRRITLDSMIEGQQKVEILEQEVLKATQRSKLMKLTSPVDGTVQQLSVHTVGGVVTPAQPLMSVVPSDNPLEVEAFIENKDIGFVKANQAAEVKIETFQYTKYGTLHAKMASVSHDAINDEKRGLIYSARVKMDRSTMNIEGTEVNLSPGMAVTVEIKTGKRRVIEYFLSPLMQYGHESLTER